jgi:hypothetical protein
VSLKCVLHELFKWIVKGRRFLLGGYTGLSLSEEAECACRAEEFSSIY